MPIPESSAAMFQNLANALLDAAEARGKKDECVKFIERAKRASNSWEQYEKDLLFAYVDGLRFGNWPWLY